MPTYHILGGDDAVLATTTSRRDAESTARRILGVNRAYRSRPSPLAPRNEDDGWRHASRTEGCASVRIVAAE